MIVCHCNIVTRAEIEESIEALMIADPSARLTPGMVYRDLGRRGRCCGCFPAILAFIVAAIETRRPARMGAADTWPTGDGIAAE